MRFPGDRLSPSGTGIWGSTTVLSYDAVIGGEQ